MAKARPRARANQLHQEHTPPRTVVGPGRSRTSATASTDRTDRGGLVRQAHSLYESWVNTWRELGYLYEGDGPYADGRALVPHPRELSYEITPEGQPDPTRIRGETEKFRRRRQIASYENLSQIIIDSITEHQYVRHPRRIATNDELARDYLEWIRDVDGLGTPMDDWLEINQALAHLYGYIYVIMDRLPTTLRRAAASQAEEERLVLRSYIPQDVPDWVSVRGELRAIKTIDPKPRETLWDPSVIGSTTVRGGDLWRFEGRELEYRFWDENGWSLYTSNGDLIDHSEHNLGTIQAVIFYARRRARIPVIGRSLLRNPDPFRDHYNLLSEFRELLRSNTFSMLSIVLGQDETVDEAKHRLGGVISSESVIFSRAGVAYVAPPGGPAQMYLQAISRVEQQIFKLVNLPSTGDSHVAEAADSRRIKALSLNRTLSRAADEAERAENRLARLWFMLTYGRDAGIARLERSGLRIEHPQEFFAQEISETIRDALDTMKIGLGPHANMLVRQSALPVVIPNVGSEDRKKVFGELEDQAAREEEAGDAFALTNPLQLQQQQMAMAKEQAKTSEDQSEREEDRADRAEDRVEEEGERTEQGTPGAPSHNADRAKRLQTRELTKALDRDKHRAREGHPRPKKPESSLPKHAAAPGAGPSRGSVRGGRGPVPARTPGDAAGVPSRDNPGAQHVPPRRDTPV